jgi:hypothetical protein
MDSDGAQQQLRNVQNVKAFFATKRAKFTSTWPVLRS